MEQINKRKMLSGLKNKEEFVSRFHSITTDFFSHLPVYKIMPGFSPETMRGLNPYAHLPTYWEVGNMVINTQKPK